MKKNINKLGLLSLLFIICLVVIVGCSKNKSEDAKENEIISKQAETEDFVQNDTVEDSEVAQEEEAIEQEKIEVRIGALKGATAIGMIQVMELAQKNETWNNYQFTVAGTADEISTGLIKGELDIAAIPCNLASVLFNKTEGKIKVAGINTLGVLYIVETGNSIQTVEDLKGKTIYSTGLGTTPQYTLNYLLQAYGIDPQKDVAIEYKTEATEVAAALSNAKDAIAMLPQPYVTTLMMNNASIRIALDVAKEWEAVVKDGSSVVTGVVVVRKEFLEANPEAVDAFLSENAASATFVNDNMNEASNLIEKFDLFKAAVAKQAIPYCNITFVVGDEMKEKINGYLNTLFIQNSASVGGKMPTDEFYYIK